MRAAAGHPAAMQLVRRLLELWELQAAGIRVERDHGFTILAVADPRTNDDPGDTAALVTRYMLGFG